MLISPQNVYKLHWDILITIVLLYSCVSTPVQIALYENLTGSAQVVNWIIDILFLIDIFIMFNSSILDENFEVIDDRCTIIKTYLKGWFLIDVIAIIPFDLIVDDGGGAANLIRYARIGRITKLLKLMKLMRLIKLQKQSQFSFMSWFQDLFSIDPDHRWFLLFFSYFTMTTHIVACTWIIVSRFDSDAANSWITLYTGGNDAGHIDLYLTSVYFTITTVTTVGYGDMSASTMLEKSICIIIMCVGVIGFAMASGALTNYISQQDKRSAAYETKMGVLDRLFKAHLFPQELYSQIKKNI